MVCQYILSYAFDKKIKHQNLLFFHDYKEVNFLSRENYINWRINNELNKMTNLKNERLRIILNKLHSFRSSIRVDESFFIRKNFFSMKSKGDEVFPWTVKESTEKVVGSECNIITEKEIGSEYPFKNFKFINNNSLSLELNNSFEFLENSFADYNIKDIKQEVLLQNIKKKCL